MLDLLWALLPAEAGLPLAASLVTGMVIGLDRELQGKPAGLRTHTLVCFASTLLTLAAARQGEWALALWPGTQIVSDPTRMAHGILTGIGFLGAGVIFREGASVHGLTTAASLWLAAALGIVYGVGMFGLALVGAGATLIVLVGLRVLYSVLPRTSGLRITVVTRADSGLDGPELRQLLRAHGLKDQPLSRSHDSETGVSEYFTATWSRSESACHDLAEALRVHPGVLRFEMVLVDDASARDTDH